MTPLPKFSIAPDAWNRTISSLPGSSSEGLTGAHILQTWEWGQVKAANGWQPLFLTWQQEGNRYRLHQNHIPEGQISAATMVLQRTLHVGGFAARMNVQYAPKGPLMDWNNNPLRQAVLHDLQLLAKRKGAIFIKIDPDVLLGRGAPGTTEANEHQHGQALCDSLRGMGWHFSPDQVQFRNTVQLDLSPHEVELLRNMKQKTRYNIRLAERKGVTIRLGKPADYGLLYKMYAATSLRDGFVIREESYYRKVWDIFSQKEHNEIYHRPLAEPLIAEVEGQPVAALVIFRFAGKAWFLYGMSTNEHREKMPNHLLQWEAIRRCKAAGCLSYDLWGAPDDFVETDPLWGVFRFKEGLGGEVLRYIGAWDFPANPILYQLYSKTLPRLLDVMRQRGKERTRQSTLA